MAQPNFGALGLADYKAPSRDCTVADMIEDYQASPAFQALEPRTQRDYRRSLERMGVVFGGVVVREWEPAWGQHYLQERANAPAAANADIKILSVAFSHAVNTGVLTRNPCREVRRHPTRPRNRYVTDAEVVAFRAHCSVRSNAYVDLKLATGARQGQLVKVRWADWNGDTLFVAAAKGGKDAWYEGQGIRMALRSCARAFHGRSLERAATLDCNVVVTRAGAGYVSAKRMMSSLWHPTMRRYLAANPSAKRFCEHDLRAKVASDSGDVHLAQERLGHQTTAITQRVYMRAPRRVESADVAPAQTDLFDHMGGALPSSSGKPALAAASAARRGAPPSRTWQGRDCQKAANNAHRSMGGPAVSPGRALKGARGLKRDGDEPRDGSRKAADAARSLVPHAEPGLSAGPPSSQDAAAANQSRTSTAAAAASSKPPARARKRAAPDPALAARKPRGDLARAAK